MPQMDVAHGVALVAPEWADALCLELGVVRLSSFTEALRHAPLRRVIVLDQSPRGEDVTNRRSAVDALSRTHEELLVVEYTRAGTNYLLPFEEDGPVAETISFSGPDVTVGELGDWLGVPVPAVRRQELAFGSDYLRAEEPVTRTEPFTGYKRMYAALDPAGQLVVAGAFSLGFGPLDHAWLCTHDPQHEHLGPDCYHGFSAYRFRESGLGFRAPDAALAVVEFTGTVIEADSAVTKCGMRGERQRVRSLEFPPGCRCGQPATALLVTHPDEENLRKMRPACPTCVAGRDTRSLAELESLTDGIPVTWLTHTPPKDLTPWQGRA